MRRDNASKYLDGSIAAAQRLKRVKPRWPGHITLAFLGDPDAHRLSPPTDVELNPSLREAFEKFGLDPKDDAHWRLLLAIFAEAYFESRRPRGGIEYWDSGKLCQLLADCAAVKKLNPDVRADGKICELVKKKFAKRYGEASRRAGCGKSSRPIAGQSAPTLRRKLQDARSPAKNRILSSIISGMPPADTRGMTTEQVRDYVIEQISKRWSSD